MDCMPVWSYAMTLGRGGVMEDACAAVPRFASVLMWLLASRHNLFGVFDGHNGATTRSLAHDFTIYGFVLLCR